jgi:ketosteroid isomerase-like protein
MTNKEIIQQMYADFGQGNIPGVLNALSDNINWYTPGPSIVSWAGKRNGKAGATDFFNQVGSSTAYEKFEPQAYIEDGDKVIALGMAEFTTTTTGKKGTSPWAMIWTLKDGKAVDVKNYWDTYGVIADTFAK